MIHPTAEVSPDATVGEKTFIWHHSQVREGTTLGRNCILGRGVYIDSGVSIGDNVKIENYACIYHGVVIEDGVFIGPHVCFTNDLKPRAVNPDEMLKGPTDWSVSETVVRTGASVGANATVICGITIGRWALVGAGSVVTCNIPDYGLVYGNPARLKAFVCSCGEKLRKSTNKQKYTRNNVLMVCPQGHLEILIPRAEYAQLGKHQGHG